MGNKAVNIFDAGNGLIDGALFQDLRSPGSVEYLHWHLVGVKRRAHYDGLPLRTDLVSGKVGDYTAFVDGLCTYERPLSSSDQSSLEEAYGGGGVANLPEFICTLIGQVPEERAYLHGLELGMLARGNPINPGVIRLPLALRVFNDASWGLPTLDISLLEGVNKALCLDAYFAATEKKYLGVSI